MSMFLSRLGVYLDNFLQVGLFFYSRDMRMLPQGLQRQVSSLDLWHEQDLSYSDDTKEVYSSIKRLSHLFEQCDRIMLKIKASDAARHIVEKCLADCKKDVEDRERAASRTETESKSTTAWSKMKNGATRVRRAFRKGTLMLLKGTVEKTLESFGVPINLLQLRFSIEGFDDLRAQSSQRASQPTAAVDSPKVLDTCREMPLICACDFKSDILAEKLLEKGADPNITGGSATIPLARAFSNCAVSEITQSLLKVNVE